MCTLNDTDYDVLETDGADENIIPSSPVNVMNVLDGKSACKKCGCKDVKISYRNKNNYCEACFLTMTTHKFRAMLGKSKLLRPNDSVLIAHSGKPNSTILLHLITADTNESLAKKLKIQCKVVYIDDGMVKGCTVEERESLRNAFAKEAEYFGLPTYIVPLSKVTTNILHEDIHLIHRSKICASTEDDILKENFDSLDTDTARDELLRQLKRKLLVTVARELNCVKIFLADTSVNLAIRVLGDIVNGRGNHLPFNVAFSDTRHVDTMILRPLRDFTSVDIGGYLDCCKLNPILASEKDRPLFPTSTRSITKDFVYRLDSEYFGTVSTIYRTSEKLATRIEELTSTDVGVNGDFDSTCYICELPVDSSSSQEELSVVKARLFSELVSTVPSSPSNTSNMNSSNCCYQSNCEPIETSNTLELRECRCHTTSCDALQREKDIEKHLCYSCRLIFSAQGASKGLPMFILNAVQRNLQVARLRNEIADFLL